MSPYQTCQTSLARSYQSYLSDFDTAGFIDQVSRNYRVPSLHRLASLGDVENRRAALMALGFLGTYESNSIVASLLRDSDRGVRLLARESVHNIWLMAGSDWQRRRLQVVKRYVVAEQWVHAARLANDLCHTASKFGEAWNELAVIQFHLGDVESALQNCIATVKFNPYQYHALVGAGHCCVELNRPADALTWYHRALGVHPDLDQVRHEAQRLRRLQKRT